MALAPYYTGDSVPLQFRISDENGAVTPSAAAVVILRPDRTTTESVDVTDIVADLVTYVVPTTVTTLDGTYYAYFVCTLPGSLIRTHQIEFNVKSNPKE